MHKWLQNLNSIVVVPNEEIIYSEDVFSSFTEYFLVNGLIMEKGVAS